MTGKEMLEGLISEQTVSFISSVDENGFPNTKAMLPPCKRDGIKTFYWHTNTSSIRTKQYQKNPKACIYFCNGPAFKGVMLLGVMEVIDDMKVKKEIWKNGFTMYYSEGINDSDFILLKFTAKSGRYYSDLNTGNFEID